jgi:hypothetical protein
MITASVSHEVGNSDDNASPVWNLRCVRKIENEKRERVERMGVIPAFNEDMDNMSATYGQMALQRMVKWQLMVEHIWLRYRRADGRAYMVKWQLMRIRDR